MSSSFLSGTDLNARKVWKSRPFLGRNCLTLSRTFTWFGLSHQWVSLPRRRFSSISLVAPTAVYVRIIVPRPFLIDHRLEINLQVDQDLWVTPNVAKLFRPIVGSKQQRHLVGDVQSCNPCASRSTKSNSSWPSVLVASQAAQITLYDIVTYIP